MIKILKRLFLFLITVTSILFIYSILYPNIELLDDKAVVGKEYAPNVKCYNLFGKVNSKITFKNKVDTSKVGESYIECNVKYLFYNINKKIKVNVVDNINPIIKLNGDKEVYTCPNKDYNEEGYTASDNYDGDITSNVKIKKEDNNIIYYVKDSSGNNYSIKRKILFEDKENPIINLKGDGTTTVYLGNKYTEPGYTASDNCDGDITDNVVSTGSVDTSKVGTYKIIYTVIDNSNNKYSVERTVIVKNKPVYNYNGTGNGNIYLTFDDGSSSLTGKILDILDSEGVKATFFVCTPNEYTKRAYNSGHTIALHSNTHNYSYIYANSNNYFNDLYAIQNRVYNTIGINSNIIRFPGGSSNMVSKKYNVGIMTYLTKEVTNRGFIYFDWNVDSNDAGSDIYNSNRIYNNVVNSISYNKTNVVLMHDSSGHSATVDALRDIIRYGKNNGYTFKAITSDTPVVRHNVNN